MHYIVVMQDNKIKLKTLVDYLKKKEKLAVNPKYHYDMRHVIMSLNNASIDQIKHQFQCHDNHLDLPKFIWLIKQALQRDQREEYFIYYQLVKLFEQIDIDKSNTIQWSQFLEYISQSKWLSTMQPLEENISHYENNLLFHAFKEESKYRKHQIKRLIEIQRHNIIAILTNHHQLNFINYQPDDTKQSRFTITNIDHTKILSMAYSQEQRLFGILLLNRNLCFIEDAQIQKSHGVLRSTGTQIQIRFLPIHSLWILQNFNSTLEIFSSPKNFKLGKKMIFKPHEQPITEISEINNPLAICTSSLDGTIKLWHISIGKLMIELDIRKQIQIQNYKGIKGISTYNKNTLSYICSWMFTSEIFLWLPSLSLSKPYYATLYGHNGLVLNCKFAWRGQLISIDDRRAVKVWNIQKLQCFQNFIIQSHSLQLYVLKQKPYLIIFDKLLDFYRFRTQSKADLQSQLKITKMEGKNVLIPHEGQNEIKLITVEFSTYYCSIILITSQTIKIMNINSQQIITIIHPPNGQQFTHSCMKGNRRLYASTTANQVVQYRIENGMIIYVRQVCIGLNYEELKFIFYHQESKILLCVIQLQKMSMIVTYDEHNQTSERIKQIQFEQMGLCQFKINQKLQQFYILSSDYIITLWDIQKLIILNKIDLKICLKQQSKLIKINSFSFNKTTQVFILQTIKSIYILSLLPNATISNIYHIPFTFQHEKINLVTSTVIYYKLSTQQLAQIISKNELKANCEDLKKVNFTDLGNRSQADYNGLKTSLCLDDSLSQLCILSITNTMGQIMFYNITDFLKPKNIKQKANMGSKSQQVRETRKAHVKVVEWNNKMQTIDCSSKLIHQKYIFVPQITASGQILGLFYYFNKDSYFHILNFQGQHKCQWAIDLSTPRYWTMAFNQIQQVLARLQKTQKALSSSFRVNSQKFKVQFLINKYFIPHQITLLKKLEEQNQHKMQAQTSMKNNTKRSVMSKNKFPSKRSQLSKGTTAMVIQAKGFIEETDNVFQNILIQKEQKNIRVRDNKRLFDKIQKSLSFTKQIKEQKLKEKQQSAQINQVKKHSSQVQHGGNFFVNQMDQLFNASTGKIFEYNIDNYSIKSLTKKQTNNKIQSSSNLLNLQTTNKHSSNSLKTRVKSSLNELNKNFIQSKIELNNFKKRINTDLLQKKMNKLKL